MARAFIGIGSNINPDQNVITAVRLLARLSSIQSISHVYRNAALGPPGQPQYYNCVVEIRTDESPRKLKFGLLRSIETALGRRRTNDRYAPRPIDLDLLLYDSVSMHTKEITLPSPDIFTRPFVAVPLAEIAPPFPALTKAVKEMPAGALTVLEGYSDSLKKEAGLLESKAKTKSEFK